METAEVPHELIRWTARRSDQIAACPSDLEHEYVTAVDDDGEPRFLPVVTERARAKLNTMAARETQPPKQKPQPLAPSSCTPALRLGRSGPGSPPWST
ncbi:hypothetical protein JQK87_04055 [Streptomyces sp. G44]|uniref:hypothetical protein n=1 Tax=Streptomyces sp. G44 TaxID=2807632 RepID=UPI00196074AE|nr:hypothetical protein [Streptomyces sp. G44]MBM7167592.1 hypothetical protein [Streptomyces sp. G44]